VNTNHPLFSAAEEEEEKADASARAIPLYSLLSVTVLIKKADAEGKGEGGSLACGLFFLALAVNERHTQATLPQEALSEEGREVDEIYWASRACRRRANSP